MKAVSALLALLTAYLTHGQQAPGTPVATPRPTIKIDGLFQGWDASQLGWKETGGVGFPPEMEVDGKEFYYANDGTFLYLFFKTSPTVEKFYAQHKATPNFAYLYVDSDADARTGAPDKDRLSGNKAMIGSDIQIWVPLGHFFRKNGDGTQQSGVSVSYFVRRWNPDSKDFDVKVAEHGSHKSDLIAHGSDGIEMAIPLADLQKRPGDKFDFICIESASSPHGNVNRISITLK